MVRKSRTRRVIMLAGCLFSLAFLAHRSLFFYPGALEESFSYVAYPMLVLQHHLVTPLKSYFEKKKNIADLESHLAALQEERDVILAQNIELQGIISFAQDTREVIEFKKRYDVGDAVLAQVLVKNFSEQSHFFLLDKGRKAGIQKDMVVIYKDCLIGRITEVYPLYSKAVLISDQSCRIAAYCTQSKATGIYQGNNQDWGASLNHISHLCHLELGELVVSSGDGLIFPRGFGIGKITTFTTQGLFHEVAIAPLIDLRAINYCYVVEKGNQEVVLRAQTEMLGEKV
jgi:rod shape-determining protein MreC